LPGAESEKCAGGQQRQGVNARKSDPDRGLSESDLVAIRMPAKIRAMIEGWKDGAAGN